MAKKKEVSKGQQRSMRTQQIVMGVIGVMIILAMVLSIGRKVTRLRTILSSNLCSSLNIGYSVTQR